MKWGIIILIFQAIATFAIGAVFLAQVVSLDFAKVAEYRIEITAENPAEGIPAEFMDLKQRYASASYILLFVSIIELAIIMKIYLK